MEDGSRKKLIYYDLNDVGLSLELKQSSRFKAETTDENDPDYNYRIERK